MLVAFEVGLQYGCLVVRDTESIGDISSWDPKERSWFEDQGSAIFAVRPAVEGIVRCEVWLGAPSEVLGEPVFSAIFEIKGGFQVEDPGGIVNIELATIRRTRQVTVFVDDKDWASKVQIVVGPAAK